MTADAPAFPILRCSAAGVPLGLPAEEVTEFQSDSGDAPGLAALLGLGPGEGGGSRILRLRSGQRQGWVRVDGPVSIRPLEELLPLPRFFSGAELGPVIGFAEEEGRVVVLIDVEKLLGLIERQGKDPQW